jgi:two-component system, NarL family, sensor kinase
VITKNKNALYLVNKDFRKTKIVLLRILILIAFFLFNFITAKSQQTSRDSLFHLLQSTPANKEKVLLYLQLGENLQASNPDSAGFYYQQAKVLANRLNDKKGLSKYFSYQINLFNQKAQFEEGLAAAQEDAAIAEQLKDPQILIQGYNDVANEYEYLGDYQPASEYYLKSLKLASSRNDEGMESKIYDNLASVFISLKDYKTADTYCHNAFNLASKLHDTVTMGNCLINMGVTEIHQQKYKEALSHFNESEKIGYKIPDMSLVADALSDKALVFYTQHKLDTATQIYHQQLAVAQKYNLPFEKLYGLFQLAVVEKDKNNFAAAEQYASQAIAIGEKLNTSDELMEMYDTMSVIKEKMGKPEEALLFKNKYVALNDSMMNAQIQTNIHHLNIQYHSAQKDKKIAEQNLSIEKNKAAIERKNMWIFIFLGGIIALTAILILSIRSYRHKQNLHRQSLLTLQKQHEVNTLKEKMQAREEERDRIGREMHDDIGSALTTILYLSDDLKEKSKEGENKIADKIASTATGVVDKMNEIIWSMNRQYDTLDDLIVYTRQHAVEFLQNHCLKYQFNVPEYIPDLQITGEQRRNIYLVIKESLHNIVKHSCASEVNISFDLNGGLRSCIHDNGKGIETISQRRFGNGLKNMRQRMESIGGSFEIENENGTIIRLYCPLDYQENAANV